MNKFHLIPSMIAVSAMAHADLKSEITLARHKVEKAAMAKDIKGAEAAYKESVTSDFKYVQGKETQDFKTFLGNFTASIAMTEKVASSTDRFIDLMQTGNKATGHVELKMTGTIKGQDKKLHAMNWSGLFTEEYRKVGGKWTTAKMIAGAQTFLVDGKLAKM